MCPPCQGGWRDTLTTDRGWGSRRMQGEPSGGNSGTPPRSRSNLVCGRIYTALGCISKGLSSPLLPTTPSVADPLRIGRERERETLQPNLSIVVNNCGNTNGRQGKEKSSSSSWRRSRENVHVSRVPSLSQSCASRWCTSWIAGGTCPTSVLLPSVPYSGFFYVGSLQ